MNQVIFAFATGVAFGALVVCIAICAAISAACRGRKVEGTPHPSAALTPSPQEEGFDEENLKKQWENFINYDGTPDGQTSIGDE